MLRALHYPHLDAVPAPAQALLDNPPVFEASAAWWRVSAEHAVPDGEAASFLYIEEDARPLALVPLLRHADGILGSLTNPYSCLWQPVLAPGLDHATQARVGLALGRALRNAGPARLEALDPALPFLPALWTGLQRARLVPLRYTHFGNWHEDVSGLGWDAYLARRPGALRETVRRRLRRVERDATLAVECVQGGSALEAGIAAYESVYAQSWKDAEPFPTFGPALMRAAAGQGALRLWVLRQEGRPVAAQYWLVWRGQATVHKLAHDEAARGLSPGTVLTALAIRDLLERERVVSLDFGRGDDDYKCSWVGERRSRIGWLVCNPARPGGLRQIGRHLGGTLRRRLARTRAQSGHEPMPQPSIV